MARIAVPTLVISARDDPFIPVEPFYDSRITGNPNTTLEITGHGGHCGFLAKRCTEHDGYWAEWRILEFAREVLSQADEREPEEKAG